MKILTTTSTMPAGWANEGRALALVGAQYGSEGKGAVAGILASQQPGMLWIRTGGPNAGHTVVHNDTHEREVFCSVPCGAVDETATLVIGAGAMIDADGLQEEMRRRPGRRVYVDGAASVIHHLLHDEGGVRGDLHQRIGSTGKGVGMARIARIKRDENENLLARHFPWSNKDVEVIDTVRLIHQWLQDGGAAVLEGTQGSGLSLTHGPWPYVTSADTNAAQLAADAGIPPSMVDAVLVARTMPIRVAGNSGPLAGETSWEQISRQLGQPVTETTTVTRKTRRVGAWDEALFARAVMLNAPIWCALTFLDYWDGGGARGVNRWSDLPTQARLRVLEIERRHGVDFRLLLTGPEASDAVVRP